MAKQFDADDLLIGLMKLPFIFAGSMLLSLYSAFVLKLAYTWFVLTAFPAAPTITYVQAVGLNVVLHVATYHYDASVTRNENVGAGTSLLLGALVTTLTLLSTLLWHGFQLLAT